MSEGLWQWIGKDDNWVGVLILGGIIGAVWLFIIGMTIASVWGACQ